MNDIKQYLLGIGWKATERRHDCEYVSPSGKARIALHSSGKFRSFAVRDWRVMAFSTSTNSHPYAIEEIREFIENYGEKAV